MAVSEEHGSRRTHPAGRRVPPLQSSLAEIGWARREGAPLPTLHLLPENPMSNQWAPIRYRDFHDIPRAFVVERQGDLLFFDCPFDDTSDDYGTEFMVFKIKDECRNKVDQPSWTELRRYADRIGIISVAAVKFDATKRQAIDTSVFALLGRAGAT
jgi:hypothetical protein